MATFVTLYKYTAQGLRDIKDAPKRVEAAIAAAAKAGIKVKEVLWLQGEYDFMSVSETSDELVATAFNLSTAKLGNVSTTTFRAFTAAEMEKILTHVV